MRSASEASRSVFCDGLNYAGVKCKENECDGVNVSVSCAEVS